MRKPSEKNLLIVISAIKGIVEIFVGPFLAAYFVSSSMDSLVLLGKYYLITYSVCMILAPFTGAAVKKGHITQTFIIGVTLELFTILFIAVTKEKLPTYYYILALLFGLSQQYYYFPMNVFMLEKISGQERNSFESSKTIVNKVIGIIIPLILGSLITGSDFATTSISVLILSILMVVSSFGITKMGKTGEFEFRKALSASFATENSRRLLLQDFTQGVFTMPQSFLFPALIYMNNITNTQLGFINSLGAALFLVLQLIYVFLRKKTQKADSLVLEICPALSVLTLLSYCIWPSFKTITLASLCFSPCYGLFAIPMNVKKYNAVAELGKSTGREELWAIRELFLGFGRVVSLVAVILVAQFAIQFIPYIFLVSMLAMVVNAEVTKKIQVSCS